MDSLWDWGHSIELSCLGGRHVGVTRDWLNEINRFSISLKGISARILFQIRLSQNYSIWTDIIIMVVEVILNLEWVILKDVSTGFWYLVIIWFWRGRQDCCDAFVV